MNYKTEKIHFIRSVRSLLVYIKTYNLTSVLLHLYYISVSKSMPLFLKFVTRLSGVKTENSVYFAKDGTK